MEEQAVKPFQRNVLDEIDEEEVELQPIPDSTILDPLPGLFVGQHHSCPAHLANMGSLKSASAKRSLPSSLSEPVLQTDSAKSGEMRPGGPGGTGARRLPASFSMPPPLPASSKRPRHTTNGTHNRTCPTGYTRRIPRTDHLPLINLSYKDTCYYACTQGDVEDLCQEMLRHGVKRTGWDLEWKVSFKRGEAAGRVALMQICYQHADGAFRILLLHIRYSSITASLHKYLLDKDITKAGVNANTDATKMQQDYGITVEGVVELSHHSSIVAARSTNTIPDCSLADKQLQILQSLMNLQSASTSVMDFFFEANFMQSLDDVRTSNWEQRPISRDQQVYAARDALASLKVFLAAERRQQGTQCQAAIAPPELACSRTFNQVPPKTGPVSTFSEVSNQPATLSRTENGVDGRIASGPLEKIKSEDVTSVSAANAMGPSGSTTSIPPKHFMAASCEPEGSWTANEMSPKQLTLAKSSVYDLFFHQCLSVPDIAARRNIKESTTMSYIADAIQNGHRYIWPCAGITAADTEKVFEQIDALTAKAGPEAFCKVDGFDKPFLRLRVLSEALADSIDFNHLRLIVAHHYRSRRQ